MIMISSLGMRDHRSASCCYGTDHISVITQGNQLNSQNHPFRPRGRFIKVILRGGGSAVYRPLIGQE